MKKLPVHSIRIGAMQASIWEHHKDDGAGHSISVRKSFKDGDVWKWNEKFDRAEFPLMAEVVKLAQAWIVQNKQPLPF